MTELTHDGAGCADPCSPLTPAREPGRARLPSVEPGDTFAAWSDLRGAAAWSPARPPPLRPPPAPAPGL